MEPAKDRTLQAAVRAHRVMTVAQETVGTKTDRGKIGFHPGRSRQFLVFPKSLRAFAGRDVVGIKYELLSSPSVPKSQRAAPPRLPGKLKPKPSPKPRLEKIESPVTRKVVAFTPALKKDNDEDEDITDLKKQVRHAMTVLEAGKAVAAFNLLKRIVGD